MSAQLQHLFESCDPDGTCSVDQDAFRDLCSRLNISVQDSDVIFEDLDHDGDGRISFGDFSQGFSNFLQVHNGENSEHQNGQGYSPQADDAEATKRHVWTTLTTEAENVGMKNSDEGKLKWLLTELQMSEQRHLVPHLESAVEELMGNLNQLKEEKKHLEESWQREKLEHERHLKRMEEELDSQVKEAELRMRMKAQAEVEEERKSLQFKMDAEMENLQRHLEMFEKVNTWLRTQPTDQRDMRMEDVKSKLDEAFRENRQLRLSLLETQTSISVIRTELLQLRNMYEEKCRELSSEREKVLEVLQEQDHLSRQLNLLHDANMRLLDSHDALKGNMESPKQILGPPKGKRGSIIGDYLDLGYSPDLIGRLEEDEEEAQSSHLRRARSMDITFPTVRQPKSKKRQVARQSLNHSDSGVSTFRDPYEDYDTSARGTIGEDTEEEESDDRGHLAPYCHSRNSSKASRPISMPAAIYTNPEDRGRNNYSEASRRDSTGCHRKLKSSASQDSLLDTETPIRKISDIKKQLGIEDKPSGWNRSWSPRYQRCSTPKESSSSDGSPVKMPPVPLPRSSIINKVQEENDQTKVLQVECNGIDTNSQNCSLTEDEDEDYEPTGPAEQTFKVIFVGDAGVGKSSFALRISKGVFVHQMSSTLGVDFLMRTIRVDGRNVAVQLWDTAGQERFRSITKTYFRKADGVMLLYDCTCEQSFLDVREWVDDIDVSTFYCMMARNSLGMKTASRIPVMIIANKTDLREMALQRGITCINTEQGEKLAKDCDTTFMEASAKDGSNVLHALANLVRSMATQQDLQLSASTMQLCDIKSKKSSCCRK